jgi:hypothetical protein
VTAGLTATPGTEPARPSEATAMTTRPPIISRARWGADESVRRSSPSYSRTVKAAFVHHTVQANSYSPLESAALIRADYVYHVRSRGWNDIGYNFVVERYGRVFEGRYGGVTRPVLGAHAGGFNTNITGVALLGTFTTSRPPGGMLAGLQRLLAWKLDLTHVDPRGLTALTSAGGANQRRRRQHPLPGQAPGGGPHHPGAPLDLLHHLPGRPGHRPAAGHPRRGRAHRGVQDLRRRRHRGNGQSGARRLRRRPCPP